MDFATLAVMLQRSGLRVSRTGADTIEVVGSGTLAPELKEAVRSHKPEFLKLLPDPTAPQPTLLDDLDGGRATGWTYTEGGEPIEGIADWHLDALRMAAAEGERNPAHPIDECDWNADHERLECQHGPTVIWRWGGCDEWTCAACNGPDQDSDVGGWRDLAKGEGWAADGLDLFRPTAITQAGGEAPF